MPLLQRRKVRTVEKLEALRVAYRKNQRPIELVDRYCMPCSVTAAGVSGAVCTHKWRRIPVKVYEQERESFLARNPHYAFAQKLEEEYGDGEQILQDDTDMVAIRTRPHV